MSSFKTVRSLQRGLLLLQVINRQDGLRAQEIARNCGLPRPTVYRLLESLENLGFVVRGPSDDAWHLTLKVKSLSSGFRDHAWVAQIAVPSMMALARQILWPIDLVTFRDYAMVVRESTHAVSPFSLDHGMVGRELPILHTAGGRAYLAFCPDDERAAIIEALRNSSDREHTLARERSALDSILDRCRTLGFGYRTEGFNSHTSSISMPIYHEGRVAACMTIIWIASALKFAISICAVINIPFGMPGFEE